MADCHGPLSGLSWSRAGRVGQGVGPMPAVLNPEFHGVWAYSTLPVLLSDAWSTPPPPTLGMSEMEIVCE